MEEKCQRITEKWIKKNGFKKCLCDGCDICLSSGSVVYDEAWYCDGEKKKKMGVELRGMPNRERLNPQPPNT